MATADVTLGLFERWVQTDAANKAGKPRNVFERNVFESNVESALPVEPILLEGDQYSAILQSNQLNPNAEILDSNFVDEAKQRGREIVSRPRRVKPVQKHPLDARPLSQFEETEASILVDQARDGNMLAFRELVERYQKRAFAIAYGVLGNADDAEDVVQDAFVKVFKKLDTFRGQSSFYTWLYRIVFNLSVDLSRRRYRHRELQFGDQVGLEIGIATQSSQVGQSNPGAESALLNPDAILYRGQLQKQIAGALSELSPEHRAVITLREIDGLSYNEISDVTGVSKGTVMSRLHHARRKLQKTLSSFLSKEGSGDQPGAAKLTSGSSEDESRTRVIRPLEQKV